MNISALVETLRDTAGKAQRSEGLSTQSFLISLAVNGVVFLAATGIFSFLKDRSYGIFQPRHLVEEKLDPLPKGLTLCVKHLWCSLQNEDALVAKYGLDCYLFLRLLQVALNILAPVTVLTLPVLVPLNYTARNEQVSGIDKFSISSIPSGENFRCWITALVAVLVNIYSCRLLLSEFHKLAELRQLRFSRGAQSRGPDGEVDESISILITDIRPEMWCRDTLAQAFQGYNMGPSQIILPGEAECHAKEAELATIDGVANREQKLVLTRTCSIFLSNLGNIRAQSGTEDRLSKARISALRREIKKIKTIAILRFPDTFTGHLVLQVRATQAPSEMNAHPIDSGEWVKPKSRLYRSRRMRALDGFAISTAINILAMLWAIPISMTGLLSQLVYLDGISSRLRSLSDRQLSAIQGIVPQIALSLLMCLFPIIIGYLTELYPIFDRSLKEVRVQKHYFIFLYFQVFLVVSISSSVTTMIPAIVSNINSVPSILAKNLPKACDYFYSYLLLQAVTQCAMVLFRLPEILWAWLIRGRGGNMLKTVRWSLVYPVFANLICICIVFSIISPLILPVAVVMFAIFRVVYTYQAIYVLETREDTAGLLYWEALNNAFVGLYTLNLFLLGLFALRNAVGPTILSAGLLVGTGLVQHYARNEFHVLVHYASGSSFMAGIGKAHYTSH